MQRFRPVRLAATSAAAGAFLLTSHAWADVSVVVDNTGGGNYTTIQGAIDALIGTAPLTQNVTIQVRDTGVPYDRAGLADANLTNNFSVAFEGINGRPTINSVGQNGLLLFNNNNISVENFN